MKKILSVVLVLFCGALTHAQNDFQKREVQVMPSSGLTITGDTNINKFECDFDTSFLQDNQVVSYAQSGSEVKFSGAVLTLDNRGFDCGSKPINRDFHDLLKTKEYPRILLEMDKINLSSKTKGVATVCITIAGKQKFYDVPVTIRNGDIAEFKGTLKLNINDFDLQPPKKLFGMIVVKDDIEISFDLIVKK